MGGSSRGTRVTVPDRQQMMREQDQFNRVNTSSPFGSQTYGTDASGRTTFTTSLSPQMQGLVDRGMGLAGRDMQRWQPPEGFQDLLAAIMARTNRRAGGGQ